MIFKDGCGTWIIDIGWGRCRHLGSRMVGLGFVFVIGFCPVIAPGSPSVMIFLKCFHFLFSTWVHFVVPECPSFVPKFSNLVPKCSQLLPKISIISEIVLEMTINRSNWCSTHTTTPWSTLIMSEKAAVDIFWPWFLSWFITILTISSMSSGFKEPYIL